jgi:DNA-binding transcriptional ArsR family regulator
MGETGRASQAGWTVGQSMAMEIDLALAVVSGGTGFGRDLSQYFASLQLSIPTSWLEEYRLMFGETRGLRSILEPAAILAGALLDGDYSRVTMAIRELTIDDALAHMEERARPYSVAADPNLPPRERLVDLFVRLKLALFQELGFKINPEQARTLHLKEEIESAVRLLKGSDLHSRLWHWLDRFYYEVYHPWRSQHQEGVALLEKRALTILGVKEKNGVIPEIDWLSSKSPLLRYPELKEAVQAGKLKVYFWVEPFGFSDTWLLEPGMVLVSFAEPGTMYDNFHAYVDDIAARSQALADPTRLLILRLIRNIGMTNTDMAAFMDLARPTVSIHARILREAGLIRSHQEGRVVRHEIVPGELQRLFKDLENFLDLPGVDSHPLL